MRTMSKGKRRLSCACAEVTRNGIYRTFVAERVADTSPRPEGTSPASGSRPAWARAVAEAVQSL